MARFKRNHTKHTTVEQARENIIAAMRSAGCTSDRRTMTASAIGYAAFPDYNFRMPQGAALSVGKILRGLEREGFVCYHCDYFQRGYYLSPTPPADKGVGDGS